MAESWKGLPNNIRQIGSPKENQKFYVEDYVYTYLHHFLREKYREDNPKAALLLGECRKQGKTTYAFIRGAIACKFSQIQEELPEEIRDKQMAYFPGWEVLGWYVSSQGVDVHIQSEIKHYYACSNLITPHYLMYEDELEQEIQVFSWEKNALRYLEGYYIYYEKNPRMQEFMIMEKGGQPQELPVARTRLVMQEDSVPMAAPVSASCDWQSERDTAAVSSYRNNISRNLSAFRQTSEMPERRTEVPALSEKTASKRARYVEEGPRARQTYREAESHKNKTPQRFVYAACGIILVLLAALGVSQMGDYQSLQELQAVISEHFMIPGK